MNAITKLFQNRSEFPRQIEFTLCMFLQIPIERFSEVLHIQDYAEKRSKLALFPDRYLKQLLLNIYRYMTVKGRSPVRIRPENTEERR